MKKVLFLFAVVTLAFSSYATTPKEVPRPECSVEQVSDLTPVYDVITLATIDMSYVIPEANSDFKAFCLPFTPLTKDVSLKSKIWDYGNYGPDVNYLTKKPFTQLILKLDKLHRQV